MEATGDFWQWMSILALPGSKTRDCIYLTFAISSILKFNMSLNRAFKIIVWSLTYLWLGIWPSHGPFGEFLNDPKAMPLQKLLYRKSVRGWEGGLALNVLYRESV